MHYILNGGGDEIGTITSPEYIKRLKEYGVRHLLIIPLSSKELRNKDFLLKINTYYLQRFKSIVKDVQVDSITLDDNDEQLEYKLKNTDAIYFSGGMPHLLIIRSRKRKLEKKIIELIASGQLKVLSGGSAGEMALGEKTIIGHVEVKKVIKGLNFLPGYILDSHFTNRNRLDRLKEVLEKKDYKYYGIGIDEDTVAIFDENYNLIHTFGKGTVTHLNHNDITVYGKK